jgi:hypothetical protein
MVRFPKEMHSRLGAELVAFEFDQYGPHPHVIQDACNEGGLGDRADKRRRVCTIGHPAVPVAEFWAFDGVADGQTYWM